MVFLGGGVSMVFFPPSLFISSTATACAARSPAAPCASARAPPACATAPAWWTGGQPWEQARAPQAWTAWRAAAARRGAPAPSCRPAAPACGGGGTDATAESSSDPASAEAEPVVADATAAGVGEREGEHSSSLSSLLALALAILRARWAARPGWLYGRRAPRRAGTCPCGWSRNQGSTRTHDAQRAPTPIQLRVAKLVDSAQLYPKLNPAW